MSMTENDKASDQSLTEEAYRPRQSEGNCMVCRGRCYYECVQQAYLCPCLYHRVCALERWRECGLEGTRAWDLLVNQIDRIHDHNDKLLAINTARAKRALHEQNKANAESKLGPREFTLTYSPNWGWDDEEAQDRMKSAIEKLTRYYKNEIIEFHAVGEFGHDGRSHVHAWYHLVGGRKITDKNFRRAYERWNPKRKLGKGFEGGHHATIERISDFAGYAEKHLDEAWFTHNITNAHEGSGEAGRVLEGQYGTDDDQEEGSSSSGSTSGAEDEGRD